MGIKLTDPGFYEKKNWGKSQKNIPKIGYFELSKKCNLLICVFLALHEA